MSFIKLVASLSVLALLHVVYAAPRCPGNAPGLRLRMVHNSIIVIQIQINGSGPYDFAVDTGSQLTMVDPSLASELRLVLEGTTGISGVASYTQNAYVYVDRIDAGAHSVAHAVVGHSRPCAIEGS